MSDTLMVESLDIDDGPTCPECGSTRWRVVIGADSDETEDRLQLVLRLERVSCLGCEFDVVIDDDDNEGDGMRWHPSPIDDDDEGLP